MFVPEWVKTKMSRQQCELLAQDQKRIEEIMQELLLENPLKVGTLPELCIIHTSFVS